MGLADKLPKPVLEGFNHSVEITKCNYFNPDGKLRCIVYPKLKPPSEIEQEMKGYLLKAVKYYTLLSSGKKTVLLAWEIGSNIEKPAQIPYWKKIRISKYWRTMNIALWLFDLPIIENYPALEGIKIED